MEKRSSNKRPLMVTLIVIINAMGWLATIGLWLFLRVTQVVPRVEDMNSYWEKSYVGLINGFQVADFLWSNLALLISLIGLWKMRFWGWVAAIMANTIWIYSMTFTLVRDIYVQITYGMVFFLFFAFFSFYSTYYLLKHRILFGL